MPDTSKRTYSYIYSKLVENEDDILGHIAFSIYKSHKIAEIERICLEKKVDYVSDADEEKRKKLIERGILRKPERKVARAGEAHSKFLNYHN